MVVTSFEGGLGVSTGGRAVEVVGYLVVMVDSCGGSWCLVVEVEVVGGCGCAVVVGGGKIFTGILSERS